MNHKKLRRLYGEEHPQVRRRRGRKRNWASIALALGATYACFGSSPAGTKAALGSFPPLLIMGVRGCMAGAVLSIWARSGQAPSGPDADSWRVPS